jgi:hypothetical protein
MLVDPEVLRGFAGRVRSASEKIADADVGKLVSGAADGLPGSSAQWAARMVGEYLASVEAKIAGNVAGMGTAVHGAGDSYQMQDEVLAPEFRGLFR